MRLTRDVLVQYSGEELLRREAGYCQRCDHRAGLGVAESEIRLHKRIHWSYWCLLFPEGTPFLKQPWSPNL